MHLDFRYNLFIRTLVVRGDGVWKSFTSQFIHRGIGKVLLLSLYTGTLEKVLLLSLYTGGSEKVLLLSSYTGGSEKVLLLTSYTGGSEKVLLLSLYTGRIRASKLNTVLNLIYSEKLSFVQMTDV